MQTRNRNSRINYNSEIKENANIHQYYVNTCYGENATTQLAGTGFIQGRVPREKISSNSVDIESFLFGIGVSDLRKEKDASLYADLRYLPTQDLYQRTPIIVAPEFKALKNQRPM
jgi:hypothetical protein